LCNGSYTGRFFFFYRQAPARRPNEVLLDFIKIIITVIVCPASSIECQTSLRCGALRKAGKASGRALGRRLSIKLEYKQPLLPHLIGDILSTIKKCVANCMLWRLNPVCGRIFTWGIRSIRLFEYHWANQQNCCHQNYHRKQNQLLQLTIF